METSQINHILPAAIADKIMAEIKIEECLHVECANGVLRKALLDRINTTQPEEGKTVVSHATSISSKQPLPTSTVKNLICTKYATKPLKGEEGYFFKEKQLKDEPSTGDFYEINVFDNETCEIRLRSTGIDRNTLRDSDEIMPCEVVVSTGDVTAECKIVVESPAQGKLINKRIYIIEKMKVAFTA